MVEHLYAYSERSSLREGFSGARLALASDCEPEGHAGEFLTVDARFPEITAKSLLAVSEIVASRFYVPPGKLARILREADPVATVSPGAVRFEGFSACCSAYVRLDMGDGALEVRSRRNGTTNVDFGPGLRTALAQVRKDSRLEISIGSTSVGIVHESAGAVERKVPLPMRWIKGFGEVQVHMARMRRAASMPRIAAQRFLRALPRSRHDHLQWISAAGSGLRTAARRSDGALPLRGGHRLRVLETLIPFADGMEVWVNDTAGSSAWMLSFGAQRVTLVLNAEPWRGFSGDGGLLSSLSDHETDGVAAVRAQLHWQDRLVTEDLMTVTGLPAKTLDRALARLAASGLVGFDLAEASYFHRVLPFRVDHTATLNPRLKAARELVAAGAVELGPEFAKVTSRDVVHEVRMREDGLTCTCPWYARNKTTRGPCKHALAVEMAMEATA